MTLAAVPVGGGEAMDMANRGRAAQLLEPAAPPAGRGEMRVEHVGLEAACGRRQTRHGEQIRFAADADPIERHVGREQFLVRAAAARDAMVDQLIV